VPSVEQDETTKKRRKEQKVAYLTVFNHLLNDAHPIAGTSKLHVFYVCGILRHNKNRRTRRRRQIKC
jgi:hypothetical protein